MSKDLALVNTVECGERNADFNGIRASTSINPLDRDHPPVSAENITENSNNNYTSHDVENKKVCLGYCSRKLYNVLSKLLNLQLD